jgi:8-oxo-dGTP pyrophosphatase MutT (NUDIX family)
MKSATTRNKQKAGVIVCKYSAGCAEPLMLLVTARTMPGFWVFPVGGVDKGETLAEAAARECREESGYCVQIGEQAAAVESQETERRVCYTFYLATAIGEEADWEQDRERRWVPFSQAIAMLPEIF